MSAKQKDDLKPSATRSQQADTRVNNNEFKALPCGPIDYDDLFDDVDRRFPKILARLGD